ncbi:MAG: hypothetical protein WCG50_14045 [Rhodoferax sp.]
MPNADLRLLSNRKSNLDDFILTIHPPTLDSFSLNLQFLSIRPLLLGKPIIPVGMSGHVAQNAWTAENADPDRYLPGIVCKGELTILGNADSTNEQIVDAVITLLQRVERIAATNI